jgi:hypothetical protein
MWYNEVFQVRSLMCHSPIPKRTENTSDSIVRRIVDDWLITTANARRQRTSPRSSGRRNEPFGGRGTIGIKNGFNRSMPLVPERRMLPCASKHFRRTAGSFPRAGVVEKLFWNSWLSIISTEEGLSTVVKSAPGIPLRCSDGPETTVTHPSSKSYATTVMRQRAIMAGVHTVGTRVSM